MCVNVLKTRGRKEARLAAGLRSAWLPSLPIFIHTPHACILSPQILLFTGLGVRYNTDPKDKERGLALIILGAIRECFEWMYGASSPACLYQRWEGRKT